MIYSGRRSRRFHPHSQALLLLLAVAAAVLAPNQTTAHRDARNAAGSFAPESTEQTLTRGQSVTGIWTSANELRSLPTDGPAWNAVVTSAARPLPAPNVSDQNTRTNVGVLAKALVYARTGDTGQRDEVVEHVRKVIGTDKGATTLPLGRKLVSYVIAAELVALPPELDEQFRAWLVRVSETKYKGRTIRSTHEDRPNNWGTHAGASRLAIARYLGHDLEVERCARVFRGWLGGRAYHAGFKFGADLSWQADPKRPVGINPANTTRNNHSVDGVLADDQRRGGPFRWPPPRENYVYEALQGALAQAVMLHRAGFADVWEWEDRALLRAFMWLHDQALFPPTGDDTWQAPLIDFQYQTHYWNGNKTSPGKSLGWTEWTHAPTVGER